MNKYMLSILAAGALIFTGCKDDNDSNPTIQQPSTFQLNVPAMAGNVYDLESTDSIRLTYTQPDYGFPAAVSYVAQYSLTNEWLDETDSTETTYVTMDLIATTAEYKMACAKINRSILEQLGISSAAELGGARDLFVRVKASLQSGYEVISNVVNLKVQPYYQALTAADPELWYLIGGAVGDGSWGSAIGTAVVPMSPVDGAEYDAETGRGELVYTGYFTTDKGFKIVRVPGEWADQWGGTDNDITQPRKKDNDGEGADFFVPSDGWYKITLNTQTDNLVIETTDEPSKSFNHIFVSGGFNGWGTDTEMTPANTVDVAHNHVWTFELETAEDTEVKFLYDGWSPNWGATGFPYGFGTNNGANIPVAAGSYTVIFNDIDGYYHFYAK